MLHYFPTHKIHKMVSQRSCLGYSASPSSNYPQQRRVQGTWTVSDCGVTVVWYTLPGPLCRWPAYLEAIEGMEELGLQQLCEAYISMLVLMEVEGRRNTICLVKLCFSKWNVGEDGGMEVAFFSSGRLSSSETPGSGA